MVSLANPYLSFEFNRNTGCWSLRPQATETPFVEGVRLRAAMGLRSRPLAWDSARCPAHARLPAHKDSPHGRLTTHTLSAYMPVQEERGRSQRLEWTMEFALPEDSPFLLWRVTARNASDYPVTLHTIDLAAVGPRFQPRTSAPSVSGWLGLKAAAAEVSPGAVRLHPSPGRLAFFSNGYQSWSFTGALQAHMRQPWSLFGPLGNPKHLNLVTPQVSRRGHFTSSMFGVLGDRDHNAGIVAGFLSQVEQFGSLEVFLSDALAPSLRLTAQCDGVPLPPGAERRTDWAFLQFITLDGHDPLVEYVEAVARENGARVPTHVPVGWCSWYHYFDRVTEADIVQNLEAIVQERERLPLEFVQLDDGYQAQVGDWFETNAKFPHGLKWLVEQIRARGQTPGLWLAPYMVRSDAKLLREHPEWFLRMPGGRLSNAGLNWFKWCYGLDPTHPGVREHTQRLISTAVREWGFPYLKLDFLYAAALPARRYAAHLTRAQAMRLALSDIRQAAGPEAFLLGCGCPLGSAIGLMDGMRISDDVAPNWEPHLVTPRLRPLVRRELTFVSTRNAIRNTINRAPFHRRWWLNDPDCLLVRDHDTRLNEAEVRSLATVIALSSGMFLVSDDMTRLNPGRHRYLAPLLPVLGVSARARDWMDTMMPDIFTLPLRGAVGEWLVAGIFNWEDAPRDRAVSLRALGLEAGEDEYFVSDFWEGTYWRHRAAQPLVLSAIPAHGARLVALRKVTGQPALIASTFHFSQGSEISDWHVGARELRLVVTLGRADEGGLRLWLPDVPGAATVAGQPLAVEGLGQGVWALRFGVRGAAEVGVRW
jgi:alpha-galactosidase